MNHKIQLERTFEGCYNLICFFLNICYIFFYNTNKGIRDKTDIVDDVKMEWMMSKSSSNP